MIFQTQHTMSTVTERAITFDRKRYDDALLLQLYKGLLKPRMIEEKMLILLRQGKISKWFSGIGQEAISVGSTHAMLPEEYVLPMHRNLGVFTSREVPLNRLFSQFQGKANGFTSGRDRSFHFGAPDFNIVGMISHLGPQLGLADGIALANVLKEQQHATLVFTGDGGASEGDFHEALNVAAVWDLPVIFVIENNQWGLSTPSEEQFRCKRFTDKAMGYGMSGVRVDGNNVLEVYDTISRVARGMRRTPKPYLVECMTFRMRGHEEASGTKYYPEGVQDEWAVKDPLTNYETYLLEEGVLSEAAIAEMRAAITEEINSGLETAYAEPAIEANTSTELTDLFTPHAFEVTTPGTATSEKRLVDAVSDGLHESMKRHDNLVIMGQDVAKYGGVFKVTEGFVEDFGADRVRNTPLCESAIVGSALGLSINGYKAVMEMQFADFVTCGFNQIVNNLAKIHWRWGQHADVVVRMPTGAGVQAGPFHSQSNEAWFTHIPGLKVVYPAFPADAKGLLIAAIDEPNPVMFFEHKALYRSVREDVPDGYYTVEIGKAALAREGDDISIITYGMGVHKALEVLDKHPNISADVVDLRTLNPLDTETIFASVKRTGKVLVLHEDTLFGGIGGELSAMINEHCFQQLDAPVVRVASLDTPVPFAGNLEANFLPWQRFEDKLVELWEY